MKIKGKLRLGLGLLFALNLIVGVLAAYYLQQLSANSRSILSTNYTSLQYVRQLTNLLEKPGDLSEAQFADFEKYLALQERNVTEKGEFEITLRLRRDFELMRHAKNRQESNRLLTSLLKGIDRIEKINLNAIYIKNIKSEAIAEKVTLVLGFITAICLLIGFSFMVNFPGYIADPLQAFLEGIKAIANKQYNQQLKIYTDDELGELAIAFNSMALKLGEYESSNLAKVLSEKKRIETIIDNMSDVIVVLDADDKVLFINTVARSVLKLNSSDVGKNVSEVAKHNDWLKKVFEKEDNKEIGFKTETADRYFTRETIDVKNEQEAIGRIIILNNVTSFHELDAAKTNFIATISHELKTPISSIKLSLKLLEDERIGEVNEEQQSLIQNIREDAGRLLRITGELLDMSQVESGNIHLEVKDVDPRVIVDYAKDAVEFQAEQKQVAIELLIENELGLIYADEEKTAWVLVNFLSNALRYSPVGSKIVIEVRRKVEMLEFSVSDEGPGIEHQYQKKVFERYFQVPSATGRKTGTGLGLAIAKDFIEAQKGQIYVVSSPGKGSRFGFTIPKGGTKSDEVKVDK